MREIVFSTIKENLKSFFHREEELTTAPKPIPETASDALEKPQALPQRIVERPLPTATQQPSLPISPAALRAALHKSDKNAATPMATPVAAVMSSTQKPTTPSNEEIHREIAEFERAIRSHETAFSSATPSVTTPPAPASTIASHEKSSRHFLRSTPTGSATTPFSAIAAPTTMPSSFFDEYEQFIVREGLPEEGAGTHDVIAKMRAFHENRRSGKEYYLFSQDLEAAAKRKLDELQQLEREWFTTQEDIDDLQKSTAMLEHEIETRTTELRTIIEQAKKKSRLEQRVAAGQEFTLSDGRKLSSLLDLKLSLRTMSDETFSHHVGSGRNDFAAWSWSCLHDEEAAKMIAAATNKQELMLTLGRLG